MLRLGQSRGKTVMVSKVVLHFAAALVLLVLFAGLSPILDSPASADNPAQSAQDSRLMQQMDYKRRIDDQRKAEATPEQVFGVTQTQESAAGLDLIVVIILAASGLAFVTVCRLRRPPARRPVTPRRPRFDDPSRN